MRRSIVGIGLTFLATAGPGLQAQTAQPFSLQGSVISVMTSGDAFADVANGIGGELQLRWNISAFSLGVGGQLSSHDLANTSDPLILRGAFLEPRYVLPIGTSRAAPYLSGRVALFQQVFEGGGVSSNATGMQFNGGGGVLVALSSAVNLDLGATIGMMRFGAYEVQYAGGGGFDYPSETGINFVLRAGLAIGLGSAR